MKYRTLLSFSFLIMSSLQLMAMDYTPRITQALAQVDSLIALSPDLEAEKEAQIASLRAALPHTSGLDQYNLNRKIFDAYVVYDSDSAMHYATRNHELACQLGRADLQIESALMRQIIHINTGLYLDAIDPELASKASDIPGWLKPHYYYNSITQYYHHKRYATMMSVDSESTLTDPWYVQQRDSFLHYATSDHHAYYFHLLRSADTEERRREVADRLEQMLDTATWADRQSAFTAIGLAQYHYALGEYEPAFYYALRSFAADIRTCNRESGAALLVLSMLQYEGSYERAYRYVHYAQQQASAYKNRFRLLLLNQMTQSIESAYAQMQERQRQQARWTNYALLAFILCLLTFTLIVYRAYHKLHSSRRALVATRMEVQEANKLLTQSNEQQRRVIDELAQVNAKLKQTTDELSSTVELLHESNYVKEEYIGRLFQQCSQQISRTEEFRKLIARKAKAKQFEDIMKVCRDEVLMQEDIKVFYQNFDRMFLDVYPDFVQDFNALLRPEEQIVLKEGELLNTDLRIYALIRLGIGDSNTIADVLHCSVQTVYNYRVRMRGRSILSKNEFDEAVSHLGKVDTSRQKTSVDEG